MTSVDSGVDQDVDHIEARARQRSLRSLLILGRLGATIHAALSEHVDEVMVGNAEVLVVASLDLQGPLRPTDIIALTGMSSGGVTKLLDRLERHGLIVREYGTIPGDRRGAQLRLTPEGEQVVARFAAALDARMDALRAAVADLQVTVGD